MNKSNHTCPSFEDISAYYDREIDMDSPMAEHIRQCQECAQVLDSLKLLDAKIKQDFACTVPEGLTDRIKAQLAQTPVHKTISFPVYKLLRAAAMIAICGALAVYMMHEQFDATSPPRLAGRSDASEPHAKPAPSTHNYPYYTSNTAYAPGGGVPLHQLSRASYGESPLPVFTNTEQTGDNQQAVRIGAQVHQVWVAKDLQEVNRALGDILLGLNIPPSKVSITDSGKSIRFIADLSKIQLVSLVKNCSARGFDLITPSEPQPEQQLFYGKKDSPVIYYAEFVQDKQ